MVFALEAPPVLEVVHHQNRSENLFAQHGIVELWEKPGRIAKVVCRTASSPDRVSLAEGMTTTSTYGDPASGLAVMVETARNAPLDPIGMGAARAEQVPSMLAAIKRVTGWRWERVAEAMGRSRQAVHGWTLGKEINEQNLERLARLYATLSFVDRGNSDRNRELLHAVTPEGRLVADLLNEQKFEEVKSLLGRGSGEQERAERLRTASLALQEDHVYTLV